MPTIKLITSKHKKISITCSQIAFFKQICACWICALHFGMKDETFIFSFFSLKGIQASQVRYNDFS